MTEEEVRFYLFFRYFPKSIKYKYTNLPEEINKLEDMLLYQEPKEKYAILCSGGVDSSILALLYNNPNSIICFVGTPHNKEEKKYFDLVASKFKGTIEVIDIPDDIFYIKSQEVYKQIPSLINDPAVIGVYTATQYLKAKHNIKYLVVGEYADELFYGYWLYPELFKIILPDFERIFKIVYAHCNFCFIDLLGTERIRFNQMWKEKYLNTTNNSILEIQVWFDRFLFAPEIVLYKNYIGTKLNKVKCVMPYYNPRISEFADNIPIEKHINEIETKIFLKEFAIKIGVPKECVYRTKTGFSCYPTIEVLNIMKEDIKKEGIEVNSKWNWKEVNAVWSLLIWKKEEVKDILNETICS